MIVRQSPASLDLSIVDNLHPPTYYSPIMASERVQRRIDLLLDEADEGIARREWAVERDSSQKVLALDPDN